MRKWRHELYERMKGPLAPRVLTLGTVVELAQTIKEGIDGRSVRSFISDGETAGMFRTVRKGLWLNANAIPAVSAAEAAASLRSGSIVSLQTVLGDAGVLNNYSSQVYSVRPNDQLNPPRTGTVETDLTLYHFSAIDRKVLESGDVADRLVPYLTYARATPEAALVHWIYLATSNSSKMKMPDTDCSIELIDMERLTRLAEAAGVGFAVDAWLADCRDRDEDISNESGWKF